MLFDLSKIYYATKSFAKTLPSNSLYVKKIHDNKLLLDFIYDVKEEYWSMDKVIAYWDNELMKLYNIDDKEYLPYFFKEILHINSCLMVPVYSVLDEKEVLFPITLAFSSVSSNGMSAGNSSKEAILQGFCEIFERYAAAEIYYKRLTPPTIPLDEFKNTTVYEQLQYIVNKMGYNIIIKDCSIDKGIPVIGTIIIDQKTMRYNFKLGADFVPHVALERCLTELSQGSKDFLGLPLMLGFENNIFDIDTEKINDNFEKIIMSGSSFWPVSILQKQPSYKYSGFNPDLGKTNEYNIKYSIDIIRKSGYNIFIRDNSLCEFSVY